uniref:Uncharacterized protein n=1 Tax=Mustela putorius furo TaxID=9669 RepID=M3Y0C6_MUSPF
MPAPRPAALCPLPGSPAWELRSTLAPPFPPWTFGILGAPGHSSDSVPLRHLSTSKPAREEYMCSHRPV